MGTTGNLYLDDFFLIFGCSTGPARWYGQAAAMSDTEMGQHVDWWTDLAEVTLADTCFKT